MNSTEAPEVDHVKTQPQDTCGEQKDSITSDGSKKTQEKSSKARKKDTEEIKKLRDENDGLKNEIEQLKDLHQRVLAEYANYKRRTELEKEQLGEFIKSETLKTLLPALDNLERAVEAPSGDDYKTGVDMTIRQLADLLARQGLEEIMPLGESFNPEYHHAVVREDAKDVETDTVTEVFQKGYKLGNRLLRPAMVKVAN